MKGSDTDFEDSVDIFGVNCTFRVPPSSEESMGGLVGTLFDSFSALRFFSSQIFSTRSLDCVSSLDTIDSVSPKLLFPLGVRGPFRRSLRFRSCNFSLSFSESVVICAELWCDTDDDVELLGVS